MSEVPARSRPAFRHGIRLRPLCLAFGGFLGGLGSGAVTAGEDLTALSLEQLLEVTITGASKYEQKQSEVAAAVSVISRPEIRAFGWRTLDEALASLPGVHTTYDRQYAYVGTRGFGLPGDYNTRLLVTINGNRLNDVVYDQAYIGRDFPVDMDLVERIEFLPGPGGAVYGQNAMFGVVNVVTRSGADLGGTELAAAAQSPQRLREGRVSWGRRLDSGMDVLLSVSGLHARGEDRFHTFGASGLSGVAAGLDGERDQEFLARVASGPWAFDVVHGARRKDDPTGAGQSDPLVAGQFEADRFDLAHLQYSDRFADGALHVLGRLFTGEQRFRGRFIYGAPFEGATASSWRGAELRLLSDAWAGHRLMVGLEGQDNRRSEQVVRDLASPANDVRVSIPGYRLGLYVQDEWHVCDTLVSTLGLREDRNDRTGTKASPRVALVWRPASYTTIKALYGRAHRAPNAYERDFGDGVSLTANPRLGGERIDTLELMADRRVGRDLTLRGTLYRWTMRDLVTLGTDPVTGLPQYQSGEAVRAKGVELSADKTWAAGVRLRGSVSLQNASYASGAPLLNAPAALGKFNLSAPLPWAGLHAGVEWQAERPRLSADGTRLGGSAITHLHLRTDTLAPGLELSLGIRNLFDKPHAQPNADSNWQNALDQDGRSVRIRLAYRY
ncbi:TonB-dependent receptor [uncultured Sphaerotilus sp.]|uniref:TonB-dependent receptor plug domain-containing protein n=1 Tax=uncultured Sphaerotilus sp. TaxID=474984 RepID=UPI0030CA22F6